jgi:hypothetical protein
MWRSEFREHAIAHFITVVMEVSRRCLAQLAVFKWRLALGEAAAAAAAAAVATMGSRKVVKCFASGFSLFFMHTPHVMWAWWNTRARGSTITHLTPRARKRKESTNRKSSQQPKGTPYPIPIGGVKKPCVVRHLAPCFVPAHSHTGYVEE